MRRSPIRHRLGLMLVLAGLTVLFVWDSVQGQGFRPPRPGMPGGPGGPLGPGRPGMPNRPPFGGGGIPRFEFVNVCGKCNKEVGGKTALDIPANCPHCGVRLINGGFGGRPNGSAPGLPPAGMPGMAPGLAPQTPPAAMPPLTPMAPMAPMAPMQPQAPVAAPSQMPVSPAPLSGDASSSSTNSTAPAPAPASSSWLIPGIIALVVMGLLGAGGVWMMIASLKNNNPPPRRSRSRSRRSRDDDDD